MSNLKIGDRVRYIGVNLPQLKLATGSIHTILKITPENGLIIDTMSHVVLRETMFEAITDKTPEKDQEKASPVDSEVKETKKVRQMKFSKKPGSAVVTYDTGETFHISRLTSIDIFDDVVPGDEILIDVTRTYTKDGLLFQERVGIPVSKFVKVVWISPEKDDILEQEVTITYDKETNSLSYAMTYLALGLDFTN